MIKSLKNLRCSQLWQATKKNWKSVLILVFAFVGETVTILLQPWPMKSIIDEIIQRVPDAGTVTGTKVGLLHFIIGSFKAIFIETRFDFLYLGIGFLILIIFFKSFFVYLQSIYLTRLGQGVTLEIRNRLFSHIINLPHRFFDESRSGDLTNRISKDTAELQDILELFIIILVRSLPTITGILIIVFSLDWVYAITFIIVIPIVYMASIYFSNRTKKAMQHQRRLEGSMASTAQEAFYYHKAIASLSMENEITDDLLADGKLSADKGIQAGRYQGLLSSSVEFLVSLTRAFVLFIGALRILHGCLTVGQLTIFLTYLNSLFRPVREFSKFMGKAAKSMASNERVEEIMCISPEKMGVCELDDAVEAAPFKGRIHFSRVHFAYQSDKEVVKGFDLKIKAGEKLAIVGNSGCGKSTIVNLLLRLYDPQHGTITIDNIDIRKFTLNSLRTQISTVLQDSYIFDTTVKENIALAYSGNLADIASNENIIAAAKTAKAHEFIQELPEGYDTHLGEGGARLSGGQKRRIAIARTILRNVPIVILDEPTVGLDAVSEKKVIEAIDNLTAGRTVIIVTHQLSTIINSDHIVVMDDGKIAEEGTHNELLNQHGLYRRLWEGQTSRI